jgi:hypothetical protein
MENITWSKSSRAQPLIGGSRNYEIPEQRPASRCEFGEWGLATQAMFSPLAMD